ncbi:hypothetical protein AgCh_016783 [Apium graveolens]
MVWTNVGLQEVDSGGYEGSINDIFRQLVSVCTPDKLALIALICWNLWNRRNRWVWDKVSTSEFGVQSTEVNMLQEWRHSQLEKQKHHATSSKSPRRWQKPDEGWVKINIDAAVFIEFGCTGVGSVIRDWNGGFIRARNQNIEAVYQPREAEAIALKETLSWVKEFGYRKCVFVTDAKALADACKTVQGRTYFHSIVSGCIDLFKHYDEVLVEFVHRSANAVAHSLARAAHSMSGVHEWVVTAPEFISDVLIIDSI